MILFIFEGDEREPRLYRTLLLTTGLLTMPRQKTDIGQLALFNNQVTKYVKPNKSVAIPNSFPIFIYEYMK